MHLPSSSQTAASSARFSWFEPALLTPTLLTACMVSLLAVGCGTPSIQAKPTNSDGGDGNTSGADDAASADASGSDSISADGGDSADHGDGATTDSGWHVGLPAGVTFTGKGQVEVEDDQKPNDMRKLRLRLYETSEPEIGKVYVWWMRTPSNNSENFGVLPYEDTPYDPIIDISEPTPDDGSKPDTAVFNGAYITYEDETGAGDLEDPVGPIVWRGEIPFHAWQHVQHVLTAHQTGGSKPGYIQQAAQIMAAVEAQLSALHKGITSKKPKLATTSAENMNTLLVGVPDAADLTGDGQFKKDLSPFTMGLAAGKGTPLNDALKHAGFAKKAAEAEGGATKGLTDGLAVLDDATKGFNEAMTPALTALEAFAKGTQKAPADVDKAIADLKTQFTTAMLGARKLGQINLER